jgi:hypothetical protein
MDAQSIIAAVQEELEKHHWETFMDDTKPVWSGRRGVVRPGCQECREPISTFRQLMEHLSKDVLPGVIEAAAKQSHDKQDEGSCRETKAHK